MNDLVITNARVILPDTVTGADDVLVSGGVIAAIGPGVARGRADVLDAKDAYLCPGLVDIHIHGAAGVMCDRAGARDLGAMSMVLARLGTTSFLATISSSEKDITRGVLSAVREASSAVEGARILGAHMEGPYLNPVRIGAQRLKYYLDLYHKQFLNRLLPLDLNKRTDAIRLFQAVLPDRITNQAGYQEDTLSYILRHTQLLPRHFLMFLNSIFKGLANNHSRPFPISEARIVNGIRQMEEFIVSEIFVAFKQTHPSAEATCKRCLP